MEHYGAPSALLGSEDTTVKIKANKQKWLYFHVPRTVQGTEWVELSSSCGRRICREWHSRKGQDQKWGHWHLLSITGHQLCDLG